MLIQDFLTVSARKLPGNTAAVHLNNRLTYQELDRQSWLLAAQLVSIGVKIGSRVGLLIENSCEYVVSYFAALRAGATVVPLNVQLMPDELAYLFQDFLPSAVLTNARHINTATTVSDRIGKAWPILEVDVQKFPPDAQARPFALDIAESSLANILYTSGTTGKPKGVMLTHENISVNTDGIVQFLELTSDDKVMSIMPFYYTYGASLLTTHIKAGGTLVMDNRFLYPNVILDIMNKEGVTGFSGVPSHYAVLLRKSALKQYTLPKLRYATLSGGPLSPALIQEFNNILPHVKFFMMYGQTEATARISYLDPALLGERPGSIGKGMQGVTMEIHDEHGKIAPAGEIGEIVVRGKGVMAGYWNYPQETANVLKGGVLYTGDLGRMDADGYVYIISRKKDMIKCGGHRISPVEIEDVVNGFSGVLECSAIGVADELMGEAITLFVVPSAGASLNEKGLKDQCKECIAPYKQPKQVVIIPSLPKTASGKIRRAELSKLAPAGV
jgi:long-chain acyl-CoA synthetase